MSQAEKEILRYIATLKQAQVAMGDLANTIESPSNQMKIFRQQLVETKVALSNLFINTFANILPYANAFLMVIKEISKAIANMFGIKITDFNSGIASQEGIYDGIADSVDNATDSVKELKRQTLGFDEIHNINENQNSGSGSSDGVSGGIDQRLLDAIEGYDNGMEKVRMKATEIRDRIMEWLGFTKKINPLTGETYFEYEGIDKTLSNIVEWWKGLNTEGKIWTSLGIALGFVNLFGAMKKIANLTGITTLFKTLLSIGNGFKNLGIVKGITNLIEYTKIYTSLANGNLLKGITSGTSAWLKQNNVLSKSNLIIAMIVAGWTSFIKQYNNNSKFKKSVDEIVKSFKNLSDILKPLKSLFKGLVNIVKDSFTALSTVIDSTVNNFVSTISLPFSMFNKLISGDFKGMLDTATGYVSNFLDNIKNTGIAILNILPFVDIETEAEKFAKTMKKIEKEIFQNGGTSITEYKKSLDNLLSGIVNGIPNVSKYNDIIKDSKSSYEGAKDSLEILLTQMQTNAYKVTADDIEKLNNILNTMTESVKESGQAFTDATTSIVNHLQEEGKISQEEALKVVKAAQMKAEAENNSAEQYRLALIELTHQLESGSITQDEFNAKQIELSRQFDKTIDVVDTAANSIKNYTEYINGEELISTKNWEELNNVIGEIGKTFDDNKEKVENSYKEQKEILEELQLYYQKQIDGQNRTLENLKRTKGEESLEYQNAKAILDDYNNKYDEVSNSIQALNSQRKDDINGLKQVTIESLLGIVATLKQSGLDMENDSNETVKEINKTLKRLGIKDEVDLSQNMNSIINQINSQLNTNIPQTVSNTNRTLAGIGVGINPVIQVDADTSRARNSISNFVATITEKLNFVFGGGGSGGGRFEKGGSFYNGTWHSIQQYANGGAPSHGTLFWAGEAGAEIVAHANGRTEVLNQSQIASAIYSAVLSAMSQVSGQANEIDVHVHTDEGTVIDRIEQRTKQTGKFPFTIPTY